MSRSKNLIIFLLIIFNYIQVRRLQIRKSIFDFSKMLVDYIAVGEASPSYLWDPDSPKLIHQAVPTARIIIMLRDPIERAYSHYLMDVKFGAHDKKSSFYQELMRGYKSQEKTYDKLRLYVEFGMYYEQVKRYFDEFGRQQVKVIIYEEFIQHPEQTVNDVLAFLGVNYTVTAIRKQHNPYSVARSPSSVWVFSFFRWLRARGIKTSKLTTLLPFSLTWSLEEKLLFKKAQKPKMEPEAFGFLQEIYHDDVLKLESLWVDLYLGLMSRAVINEKEVALSISLMTPIR